MKRKATNTQRTLSAAGPIVMIGCGALSIVFSIWIACRDYPSRQPANWAEAGQKGDFWGGHLAPGATLAGTFFFLATLILQWRQLREQQEEIQKSHEIAKQQSEAALEHARVAAEHQRSTERQARIQWQSSVTTAVLEAIRHRQQLEFHRNGVGDVPRQGLENAVKHSTNLVDNLTRRGSHEWVDLDLRNAWRDAVGLQAIPRNTEQ